MRTTLFCLTLVAAAGFARAQDAPEKQARIPRPLGVGLWPGFTNPDQWPDALRPESLRKKRGPGDAVRDALDWLARHQDASGLWRAADFAAQCEGEPCAGKGASAHDMGVTGLAMLAFFGAGHTHKHGTHKRVLLAALKALHDAQDDKGCFTPDKKDPSWIYSHAVCTMAASEAYGLSGKSALLEPMARTSAAFLLECRNPGLGWRYGVKPGDTDSSCTIWAVLALKSASLSGLEVPPAAFQDAVKWFDKATDPKSFRTGYTFKGDPGARLPGMQKKFPNQEAMTAGALAARMFAGQAPSHPMIQGGWTRLENALPRWDEASGTIDMVYWYFGTLAAFNIGRDAWKTWSQALGEALIPTQRRKGCARGSWDPAGAWGSAGGRVYATALNALSMEILYRGQTWNVKEPGDPDLSRVDLRAQTALPPAPEPAGAAGRDDRRIRLPRVHNASPMPSPRFFEFDVTRTGRFRRQGNALTPGALYKALRREANLARDPEDPPVSERKLVVRADEQAPWRHVRHVMRVCASPGVGLRWVYFSTKDRYASRRNPAVLLARLPRWPEGPGPFPPPGRYRALRIRWKAGASEPGWAVGDTPAGSGERGLERALEILGAEGRARDLRVLIDADGAAPFRWVVEALDRLVSLLVAEVWFLG